MKSILITGINRGLGKALFELSISKGYYVFGILRNALAAEELKRNLPANGKIIVADLSNDASIKIIQEAVQDRPIDLLINNAGIGGESYKLDEVDSDELLTLFNIHCLGVLRTTKSVKHNLLTANDPMVINLNSRFGSITRQSNGTYNKLDVTYSYRIAKAAQNMLTNCLRNEFKNNIKFISLHPGKMKTAIAQTDADMDPESVARKILEVFETNKLNEENGIVEIGQGLIEW